MLSGDVAPVAAAAVAAALNAPKVSRDNGKAENSGALKIKNDNNNNKFLNTPTFFFLLDNCGGES